MNHGWRSISHLKLDLDVEGLSETLWLRNGDEEAMGFYCDLSARSANGDDDLRPTSGWYDTDGRSLNFTPAYYRPVEEAAARERPPQT
jgi:hypothetical protein